MMEAQGLLPVSGARRRRPLVQCIVPARHFLCAVRDAMFVAASRKTDATAHGTKAFCSGDDSLQACEQTRA